MGFYFEVFFMHWLKLIESWIEAMDMMFFCPQAYSADLNYPEKKNKTWFFNPVFLQLKPLTQPNRA